MVQPSFTPTNPEADEACLYGLGEPVTTEIVCSILRQTSEAHSRTQERADHHHRRSRPGEPSGSRCKRALDSQQIAPFLARLPEFFAEWIDFVPSEERRALRVGVDSEPVHGKMPFEKERARSCLGAR